MGDHIPNRDEAFALLREYNQSDSLIKHALCVESVMRYAARKLGQDEDKWGIIGLVHDLDYEQFPEEHCKKIRQILEQHNWPEEYIRATVSHGWGICADTEPLTDLEKYLYAVDELTGLIVAVTLVRPSKNINDVKVKSVMKKWKDRAFAAGADRGIITKGAAMLGLEIRELVEDCLAGMREVATEIGLAGVN